MEVSLIDRAIRELKHLPIQEQNKIKKKLQLLRENPLVGKKLTGDFAGTRSLRAWPYRIIYLIEEEKKIVKVITIIHRQGAYK